MSKQIMRIGDIRELCDFISTHSAELNHVKVASSFQSTSSFTGRRGEIRAARAGHPSCRQHALDTLENAATRAMEVFQLKKCPTFCISWPKSDARLAFCQSWRLERRTETISGEYNSLEVANTLWAFATMGEKPAERMMGQLELRAEAISGQFNSQVVVSFPPMTSQSLSDSCSPLS
jgi:hypothetical protein